MPLFASWGMQVKAGGGPLTSCPCAVPLSLVASFRVSPTTKNKQPNDSHSSTMVMLGVTAMKILHSIDVLIPHPRATPLICPSTVPHLFIMSSRSKIKQTRPRLFLNSAHFAHVVTFPGRNTPPSTDDYDLPVYGTPFNHCSLHCLSDRGKNKPLGLGLGLWISCTIYCGVH